MEDKKIILENAAYKVFLEKGYKHANIADITKTAGIAVGSFYKFYQSKFDPNLIQQLLKVCDFIYYIDCHIDVKTFRDMQKPSKHLLNIL